MANPVHRARRRDATLRKSLDERCRLVEVIGEPGIGKTRLVAELAKEIASNHHRDLGSL